MSRILVAMSGGVDSSVAAALLKDEGHEVIGVWMRLHDVADSISEFKKGCCSLDAAEDARRVAGQLGIPFYVLNLEREFDEGVLSPFLAAYLDGTTPSPCVDCNATVKFGALLGQARHLYDCEAVATGHYARREVGADGQARMLRARDEDKDQTYFLYGLRQDQLREARFPLGELTKAEVRQAARRLGLATADKPESQGICFIPNGDVRGTLKTRAGWEPEKGSVLDADGRQVGEHAGAVGYTPGQRQGLGISLGSPRYVSRVDPISNTITLGRREDLETTSFEIEDVRFVDENATLQPFRAAVRIRHRAAPIPATISPTSAGEPGVPDRWTVRTDTPVWAIAPRQAAVLYDGDVCLGGGRIARAASARQEPPGASDARLVATVAS